MAMGREGCCGGAVLGGVVGSWSTAYGTALAAALSTAIRCQVRDLMWWQLFLPEACNSTRIGHFLQRYSNIAEPM
jgi:hypothetical protein